MTTSPETTAPAGESVWAHPYRWLTIGLLLIIMVSGFETLAVATILPAITEDLGGLEWYGWAFSAFLLARLIGITLAGAEVDRRGPALPFVLGVLIFVAGLLLSGLATSMPLLIAGRVVQGLGSGVIGSVAYVIIALGYPEHVRPRMLALNSTAWVVPGLIGPALAGLIGDYIGWRWVFLGLAPLPLLAIGMCRPRLRALARAEAGQHDWGRSVLALRLALGAALLMIGLGQPLPWGAALGVAGALIAGMALRPLLPEGTLRAAPGLPAAVACMGLLSFTFFGVDAFIPLLLTSVRGQPSLMTGLAFTAATLAWTSGSWVLDRWGHRASRRTFALGGLGLILVGTLLTIPVAWPSVPVWLIIPVWGLAGLGIGITYTTLSIVTLELAPPGREGVSSAALQVNDTLGSALATGLGGAVVAAYGAAATGAALQLQFGLMVALALLAILAAARIPGRRAPAQPAPGAHVA